MTKLEAAAMLPEFEVYTREEVERVYAESKWWAVIHLCESHERLRAELDDARNRPAIEHILDPSRNSAGIQWRSIEEVGE